MGFSDYLTANNVIAAVLVIVGLVWLICSIVHNTKVDKIPRWPKVDAVIVNSTIDSSDGYNSIGRRFIDSPTFAAKYFPKVSYRYTLNGKTFYSEKTFYGKPFHYNSSDINAIMAHLQPGMVTTIYYNPANLSESYMYNGKKTYSPIVLSIILILIGGFIFYRKHVTKKALIKNDNLFGMTSYPVETPELPAETPYRVETGPGLEQIYRSSQIVFGPSQKGGIHSRTFW